MNPAVSVVMAVYNGEDFLRESIDSILAQTFDNFEFIIIDDGSSDETKNILESYDDERIRLFHQANMGLVKSLNRGIKEARAELIARQDADDISLPHRLQFETEFLNNNPECAMVGTASIAINESGQKLHVHARLIDDKDIREELYCANPFGHGTIMARKNTLLEAGGYRDDYGPTEDYDLWRRVKNLGTLANLPHPMYHWRINPNGVSQKNNALQVKYSSQIQGEIWSESAPGPIGVRSILRQTRRYKRSPELSADLASHYLLTQLRLGKTSSAHGRRADRYKTLIAAILAGPTGWRVLILLIGQNARKLYWRISRDGLLGK
jgi:glycosyltransferase involved in cell wall biosynthesis